MSADASAFTPTEDDQTTAHATRPDRDAMFAALGREVFDLLVVGGGITGAGVARDAALRGLRVALVEKHDYASGTSSRSSRLVHGGVRYLEYGQVGLVFESSRERRTLQRIAPHLVRPLAFTWPVYRGARVPRWKLSAGLTLYDVLSLFRNRRHERLDLDGVRRREPQLRTEGLVGGALYWDAATDDVRLTLATVLSAQHAGAVTLNHAAATELVREGARVAGAIVQGTVDTASVTVRARVVVNATGPWTDEIERMADARALATVPGTGGKLTTFRAMAAQVVDTVERGLGHTPSPCRTAALALAGGDMRDPDEEVARAINAIGDEAIARRLVSAYGTAWHGVWSLTEADPALAGFVESGLAYVYAELLHAITHEQAATLGDLLIRRTPIAFETRDHGRTAARRIAPVVGRWMRWSGVDVDDAIEAYDAESERMFRVAAELPATCRPAADRGSS